MKKILPFIIISLFMIPLFVGAHGNENFDELNTGPEMMQYIEDQAIDGNSHEEMEDLMIKMMNGNLSQQEAVSLSDFMQKYPGPHGMMMNRVFNDYDTNLDKGLFNNSWGMHSGFGGFGWLGFISFIVWTIAGIILIVFLGKKIGEKTQD